MAEERASVSISLDDQISQPLAAIQQQFEELSRTMGDISSRSREAFAPISESTKQITQQFAKGQEELKKFTGDLRNVQTTGSRVTQELTEGMKNLARAMGEVGREGGNLGRTITSFAGAFGGLLTRLPLGVTALGGFVVGAQAASRALADLHQKQETLRQELGTSQHMIGVWRAGLDQLGASADEADALLSTLSGHMRELRTFGTASDFFQHQMREHPQTGFAELQKYQEMMRRGATEEEAARERLRDIAKHGEPYQRAEERFLNTRLRILRESGKVLDEAQRRRSDPAIIAAEKQHEDALKEIARVQKEYNEAMEQWEPTFVKIETVVIKGLNEITKQLTAISQMKLLPDLNQDWKDFLFGKPGPENPLRPFRTDEEEERYRNFSRGRNMLKDRMQGRQAGGAVAGGAPYLVGEAGPELFVPHTSGAVVASAGTRDIPVSLRGIDQKEAEGNVYLKTMSEALTWMRGEQERAKSEGVPPWATGTTGAGGAGAGGGMGALPGWGGGGEGAGSGYFGGRGGGTPADQAGVPPGLRVPTSPAEAPETLAAAQAGGFMAPGATMPGLAGQRAKAMAELQDPATRSLAAWAISHEQGSREGRTDVLESLVNRAVATGTPIRELLTNGFYGPINRYRAAHGGRLPSAADWALKDFDAAASAVGAGRNELGGRTDQGMFNEFKYRHGMQRIRGEWYGYQSAAQEAAAQRSQQAAQEGAPAAPSLGTTADIRRALEGGTPADAAGPPPMGAGGVSKPGTGARGAAELDEILAYAGLKTGLRTEVAHGLEGGHARHNIGRGGGRLGAYDLDLYDAASGRKLDMRNTEDQARIAAYVEESVAAGATGVGAGRGTDYMGPHRLHIGGGTRVAWGAGGRGANAPQWLRDALDRGTKRVMSPEQRAASVRSLREAQNESLKATQKVEVNGSAKVSVDVKAPPGTKAKAEGAGSLKDIDLKRTPQMEPADSQAGQFPG